MQTPMPATGPLVDWLRAEAHAPFTQPRGDVGDQLPLVWLVPLAERDSRIPFAVGELLREGDLTVSRCLFADRRARRSWAATALERRARAGRRGADVDDW
jgi:hypothetical protein